jgi:aryl-alcohol dehydrogenase-like predicted oxidoreductase
MKRRTFLKGIGTAAALPAAGCSVMKSGSSQTKGSIQKRMLGKTGIEISMLGFGSHMSEECLANPKLRDKLIKAGYEGGINFYDIYDHKVAENISPYLQFEPMGRSLKGFRKNVVISLCQVEADDKAQTEINGALVKLQTDYIDCYRLYTVNDFRIELLDKNKKAGKIRSIGVVSHEVNKIMKYLDQYGDIIDFVFVPCNFHHNNAYWGGREYNFPDNDYSALVPRCEKLRLGIVGIKSMGSDQMITLAKKNNLLKKGDIHIAQAMLRYVYQSPGFDCGLVSMNTMKEVDLNLQSAYNPTLSIEEKEMLAKLSNIATASKSAYLRPNYRWLENWASKNV